jgi:Tol biopolymer transport system component
VVQAENDWHPLVWWRNDLEAELVINGMATELYAVSPDGQNWVRLTNYMATWSTTLGVMSAHFSADGKRLTWSKMIAPASGQSPWGTFRLMVADFVVGADGTPSLQNTRDVTPSGDIFVEAHGLSPDGKSALFTSNTDPADPNNMDVWKVDLATRAATQLTNSPYWDEHAAYSPSGQKIAYMAGELGVWYMSADLMIMNADGSNKQRLTSFNRTGQPGNTSQLTMVMHPTWNGAGTRMAVTEQLANGYPGKRRLWVLNFAGVCT